MLKVFEFIVGAFIVALLFIFFFWTTTFIVGLNLSLGYQDALVFFAWCFWFFIGALIFADFDK